MASRRRDSQSVTQRYFASLRLGAIDLAAQESGSDTLELSRAGASLAGQWLKAH